MQAIFQVGDPVEKSLFVGRKALLEELTAEVTSLDVKQHFALISPRRTGKTSVLNMLYHRIRDDPGILCVYFNAAKIIPFNEEKLLALWMEQLFIAYTEKSAMGKLTKTVTEAFSGSASALAELLSGVHVGIGDSIKLWFEFKEKKKGLDAVLESIFVQGEKVWKKKIVVIIDEFQQLQGFGDAFLWSLRTNVQAAPRTSLVIAGSQVSTMNYLTGDKKAPFYNMFVTKQVGALEPGEVRSFVSEKLRSADVSITNAALERFIELTGAHPYYVQWLGRACYWTAQRESKKTIDPALVEESFDYALSEMCGHLEEEFTGLKGDKREVMVAMGLGNARPSEIARFLDKEITKVSFVLIRLMEEGFVQRVGRGSYRTQDPVFGKWIHKKMA